MKKLFPPLLLLGIIPLVTLAQAGLPDSSFDDDGITIFDDESGYGNISSIGLQSNGKIIVAGRMVTVNADLNNWVFYRFTSDGKLDSTFGTNGKTSIDFNSNEDFCHAITIQPDDKIVACGTAAPGYKGAIVRLTPDGALDASFSNDGKLILPFISELNGIALEPGGKIIVTGRSADVYTCDFLIMRFLTDGSDDISFQPTSFKISSYDYGYDVAILPDGKILTSGITLNDVSDQRFVVLKYQSNGTIDSTFGTDGVATVDYDQYNEEMDPDIAFDSQGRIVVSGYGQGGLMNDIVVTRFTASGVLDSTFGADGKLTTDVFGSIDRSGSITIQPDDKILVSGKAWEDLYTSGVVLIRYKTDGSIDTTFGNNGFAWNSFDDYSGGTDVILQPDGKILVSAEGSLNYGAITEIAVLRYLNDIAVSTGHVSGRNYDFLNVYPNPLHDNGIIQFSLSKSSDVKIDLFDLQGRKIKTILERDFEPGDHQVLFQKENLSAGVYLVQLKSKNGIPTKKLVLNDT